MPVTDTKRRPLHSLSIVLPCFDEAPNVATAVAEARQAAERFAHEHEIVVVDDGSADDTLAIAQALAAVDPCVRVVAHEANRGYGAAVRSGIAASSGEWVLLTDGDLQFDLGELSHFLDLTAGHDLIAGYRLDRADPPARRLAAHAWNRLMRRSFGVQVEDVDCAFKLVRGPGLRALPLSSDGAMVSTELLVRAELAGWRGRRDRRAPPRAGRGRAVRRRPPRHRPRLRRAAGAAAAPALRAARHDRPVLDRPMTVELLRFTRFSLVGAINTALTLITFVLLTHAEFAPAAASATAFAVGATNGYWLNRSWTFRARGGPATLSRYVAVQGLGALCSAAGVSIVSSESHCTGWRRNAPWCRS